MRKSLIGVALLFFAACSDDRPPAPTAAESEGLDAAEAMLNEEGAKSAGPTPEPVGNRP